MWIGPGLVDQLVISRAGAFSCPVACGAVLLGRIDLDALQGMPAEELQKALQVHRRPPLHLASFRKKSKVALRAEVPMHPVFGSDAMASLLSCMHSECGMHGGGQRLRHPSSLGYTNSSQF